MSTEKQEVVAQLNLVPELNDVAKATADFTSLGKCLQAARIQAGYSVPQIANEMHLEARFIEYIERDRFKELGAPVFVKGHLRRYARLVNVDETLLHGLYESLRDPPVCVDPIPVSMNSVPESRRLIPNWALWVAASVFLVVSISTIVSKHDTGDDLQAAKHTVSAVKIHNDKVANSQIIENVAVPAPVSKSAVVLASATLLASANAHEPDEVTMASPAMAPGHVSLTMTFAGESWVEIYDANKHAVVSEMGHANAVRHIEGVAPLRVTFGSAPQVMLQVNGRNVTIPAKRVQSSVARFSVDSGGIIN